MPPLGFFAGLCVAFDAALMPLIQTRPRFPDMHNPAYEAAHDKWVCTIADAVGTVRYIPRTLLLYRQHGANICGVSRQDLDHHRHQSFRAGALNYQAGAALALQYGDVFERLAAAPEGARWRARLERAALRYRHTQRYLLARAVLYRAPDWSSRLAAFARLVFSGDYRFNPTRPPYFALAKDTWAVLRPSLMHRARTEGEPENGKRDAAPLEHKS
jgi:hypothetical protein